MLLGPIESLRGRVRLIIMLAVRKDGKLVKINSPPICFGWQVHESVFNGIGYRMEPHDLFHSWLIASHAIRALSDQFLDELCPRSFVLDQDVRWPKPIGLTPHRSFQIRI